MAAWACSTSCITSAGNVRAAGFRFVTVDLAGIQSGAFTLPLVAVTHG